MMNALPLHGWILSSNPDLEEFSRAREAAARHGVVLDTVPPASVDVLVDPSDSDRIWCRGESVALPQFAVAAFFDDPGGMDYDFALMRQLGSLGVVCINPVEGMLNAHDKLRTLQILSAGGLPVPRTMLWHKGLDARTVEARLGLPLVMKLLDGSRGEGVILIRGAAELANHLEMLQFGGATGRIIFQELIEASSGRDLRVYVIDGQARACMQRQSGSADGFKANLSRGGSAQAFPMSDAIRNLAEASAGLLGLVVAGVDLLFTETGFVVCEVNSVPGFKGIEAACNVNIAAEVLNCIGRHVALRDQARAS